MAYFIVIHLRVPSTLDDDNDSFFVCISSDFISIVSGFWFYFIPQVDMAPYSVNGSSESLSSRDHSVDIYNYLSVSFSIAYWAADSNCDSI